MQNIYFWYFGDGVVKFFFMSFLKKMFHLGVTGQGPCNENARDKAEIFLSNKIITKCFT